MIDRSNQLSNHAAYRLDQWYNLTGQCLSTVHLLSHIYNFNWLLELTCEMIDRSYQLSDHAAYQIDPWSYRS